jgi:hypothetical protein
MAKLQRNEKQGGITVPPQGEFPLLATLVCFALCTFFDPVAATAGDPGPVVAISDGRIQGLNLDAGGAVFKGIPLRSTSRRRAPLARAIERETLERGSVSGRFRPGLRPDAAAITRYRQDRPRGLSLPECLDTRMARSIENPSDGMDSGRREFRRRCIAIYPRQ